MAARAVDLDTPGKYPIVLSDALLGKASKETYTSIRYNHKSPNLGSSTSSRLQPSDLNNTSYDLSLSDGSEKYAYHGIRTSGDGKYVLIFNPVEEHFVLHRIDSTFNMNMISSPWDDPASLRSKYPQVEPSAKPSKMQSEEKAPQKKAPKAPKAPPAPKVAPKRKKSVAAPKKAKPVVVREPTPEEEDSDDGFTIEDPGQDISQPYEQNSAPVYQSHLEENISDEDEDAEGEDYESEHNMDVDHLKLPSPVNNGSGGHDDADDDFEQALEAELEGAFESDESEEE